jgi:CHAT domain/Lecithin:cholesterol acyltransferase
MKIKKLIVRGEERKIVADNASLQLHQSYAINTGNRAAQAAFEIDMQDDDKLLEFIFDDNTTWMCDAATLHELFPEENLARDAGDAYELPGFIKTNDADRGLFGDIALKILNVFLKDAVKNKVGDVAKKLEDHHLQNGIFKDDKSLVAGVDQAEFLAAGGALFNTDKLFAYKKFEGGGSDKPYLLFIHGTNSDASSAYKDFVGTEVWNTIHDTYRNNVLVFQHRTLTQSPLQNAVQLATLLPDNAVLHIISHSRGGLIGDILTRYSPGSDGTKTGFSKLNIELLKKEDGRDADVECIKQLNKIFAAKKIEVKKNIRVACPAAGTTMASKKLGNIFNVFFNLLGGSLNPFADTLKELIAETVKTKDNVNVLPGVEAMNPDSPFIKILNDRSEEVSVDGSSLIVISGNGKASLSFKGLLIILGKLFYGKRNDLVVDTDSMYLGASRKGSIQYFFDQATDVNHLKYFANNRTREAILFALKTPFGETIPGFTSVPQLSVPASDRGERGLERGELFPAEGLPSGKKPIVILLPGIMGSNLYTSNGDKLWLAYLRSIVGGLTDLEPVDDGGITAASIIKTSYKQLRDRLSFTYDVVVYPFDWRKQLAESAAVFNDTILSLLKFNQPIKIIGHSMGGVLVRDFIINHDSTWQKLNASKGFKLLFLGSPLGGSSRILTVLFGQDAIINSLNMLDRVHTKKELLSMFAAFPGILSLLPLSTDEGNDFASEQTWRNMRTALGDAAWPLPAKAELDVFKLYRDNIIAKREGIDYSNMIYIAGKDKHTPCGYYVDDIPPRKELVFLVTGEGDQSVTWETGIPKKMIDANAVYYVNVSHGTLANAPGIFDGIEEVLDKGSTTLLSKTRPAVRSEEKKQRMPASYNYDFSEQGVEDAVFGVAAKGEPAASQIPVSVCVGNGDLAYASFPVLAGHFKNDGILYAEKSIDNNLRGILSARHALEIYPGNIGTSAVITADKDHFPGAIIVGLGEPGTLTGYLLAKTVEKGISKYLLNLNRQSGEGDVGISSLMIGCDYGGLTIENSLKAIIEGVNNANDKVAAIFKNGCRTVQYIEMIELYEDKALSCMYALSKIESTENKIYNIKIGNKKIRNLFGSRKRMPLNLGEEWWNRITIKLRPAAPGSNDVSSLIFGASTGDAREEEKELFSSTPLIDLFIEEMSIQNNWSAQSAKTIFELMIPNAFKERLKKKGSITWILDKETAAYPWELLQDNTANAKPLCVDAGMIRQLSTPNFRMDIKRTAVDKALIVADPLLNKYINQLPGAAAEGKAVKEAMDNNGYSSTALINKSASDIVRTLFCDDYKIIHLAGHGVFNPGLPKKSGMVIGNEIFLTTFDIEQMSAVPELVFVNCCHLGKTSAADEKFYQSRYKLAANIGIQLIEIGVKAVIAAGWAVNDDAAKDFASIFYNKMFAGYSFGDAVKEARANVYEKYGFANNTWGAYQCYGDPFYKLTNRSAAAKSSSRSFVLAYEAEIQLNNLKNELDTRNITFEEAVKKLESIQQNIKQADIASPEIIELEALIYTELAEYEDAIKKFALLKNEESATFSVLSLEKYCNVRGKKCMTDFMNGSDAVTQLAEINEVIAAVHELLQIGKTSERLCLLGSAYKRKAYMLSDAKQKLAAYKDALAFYTEAFEKNENSYPLNSMVVLQTIINFNSKKKNAANNFGKLSAAGMGEEIKKRQKELRNVSWNMNYWDIVDDTNFELCLLLLNIDEAKKEDNWGSLENKIRLSWKRAGSKGKKNDEIQNFELIGDLLQTCAQNGTAFFKQRIDTLKENLKKIITDK